MNLKHMFAMTTALLVSAPVMANDCVLVDKVAAASYDHANAALSKGWLEAARSAAYFFWYVHDLGECKLTRAMAVHMTKNNLGRGTEPTGPGVASKFQASLSIPSAARFAQVEGPFSMGVFAPETVMVNGLTYKLQGGQAAVPQAAIEEFLKDPTKSEIRGVVADRAVLRQWKDLPISPSVGKVQ